MGWYYVLPMVGGAALRHTLKGNAELTGRVLSLVSMTAIAFIITIITETNTNSIGRFQPMQHFILPLLRQNIAADFSSTPAAPPPLHYPQFLTTMGADIGSPLPY